MILKKVIYYLLICSLEYWTSEHLKIFGVTLNFSLMACLTSVAIFPPAQALLFSFFLGLFADFSSWGHFGLYCLSYTLIAYFLISVKNRTDLTSPFSRVIMFFLVFYFNLLFYSSFYFAIYKTWFFGWKDFVLAPIFNILFFVIFYEISERYLSERKCL